MLTRSLKKFFSLTAIAAIGLMNSPSADAETLYGMTFDGNLYSVSTTDASSTRIGQSQIGGVLSGLEYNATTGQLIALTTGNDQTASNLFQINPQDASATLIGPTGWPGLYEGGLKFAPTGELYALNGSDGPSDFSESLLRIDPLTGAATRVVRLTNNNLELNGLAWTDVGLVGIDDTSDQLLRIDITTGDTSVFAELPINAGFYGGMASDLNGTGYFTSFDGGIYSFDLTDGSTTRLGDSGQFFGGLAISTTAVPEPQSFALLGLGLLSLIIRRHRRHRVTLCRPRELTLQAT